ncbi:MAG: DeoR family transcriptional regulator [Fuerstiella sp.]|jgi:DeoR/GlpR family transcriptional regulator of sugar metabolism|nr:DeoR family transcriptional regulator [Fuerstiella sp.]
MDKNNPTPEPPSGVQRLVVLDSLLLMSHWKLAPLAVEFDVSVDTVRRDIGTLVELGSDAKRAEDGSWTATKAVFTKNVSKKK